MTLSVELTGLQAAQTDLDTIGNNIANVGTVGFKSSTPDFSRHLRRLAARARPAAARRPARAC